METGGQHPSLENRMELLSRQHIHSDILPCFSNVKENFTNGNFLECNKSNYQPRMAGFLNSVILRGSTNKAGSTDGS